jgi:hypothetical protein
LHCFVIITDMKTLTKTAIHFVFSFGFALLFFSCSDESSSTKKSDDDDAGKADSAVNYFAASDPLFSIDHFMDVELTIEPGDWETLRYSPPGFEHYADPNCPSGPRPDTYQWFKATATVDGISYGEIDLRKKGLMGSMEPMKPSMKIKFGKDATPLGVRRMTLNNSVQDLSFARECLAYFLFRKAGLAAPRCGLARVHVNGQDLGVYTHIEEIKSPMLAHYWGDGSGSLYEITMADFVPNLLVMFEYKNDSTDVYSEQLEKTSRVLEKGDDILLEELGKYLDIDKFITYWAMEVLISHWDSYSGNRNNSYLYRDPNTGLYNFIPWGTDQSFREPEDWFGPVLGRSDTMPWAVYAHGAIARRLYAFAETRRRYESTLRSLLEEVWDEKELLQRIDTVTSTATPVLSEQLQERVRIASDNLKLFVSGQKARLSQELDDGLVDWELPPNPPLCARSDYVFEGTLQTNFNTLEEDILETGSGTVTETTQSQTTAISTVRGLIGYDDWSPTDFPVVELRIGFGPTSNEKYALMNISIPEEQFVQGNTVSLNWGEARTSAEWVTLPDGTSTPAGYVITGELTFTKIDPGDNGTIEIAFEAPFYSVYVSSI